MRHHNIFLAPATHALGDVVTVEQAIASGEHVVLLADDGGASAAAAVIRF